MPDPHHPLASPDKDLKVKIPVRHHLRLHSMKVLTGKQISDSITEALDAYFAAHGDGSGDGVLEWPDARPHEDEGGSPEEAS